MGWWLYVNSGCCAYMKFTSMSLVKQLMILLIGSVLISQFIVFFMFYIKSVDRVDHYRNKEMSTILKKVNKNIAENPSIAHENVLLEFDKKRIRYSINKRSVVDQDPQVFELWDDVFINGNKGIFKDGSSEINEYWTFWFSDYWKKCDDLFLENTESEYCPYEQYEFPMPNQQWLFIVADGGPHLIAILVPVIFSSFISIIIIFYSVLFSVRKITRPIKELNKASQRFGRGENNCLVEVNGSKEISETITAFNEMQQRIGRFVDDRTKMLAAISHDLRTPITSLRLRSEFITDDDLKRKMVRTLEDMQQMVESCLSFTREDQIDEGTVEIDLVELLAELAEDSSFIEFSSLEAHCFYSCQRITFTRAIVNILDNAVKYGKVATISLQVDERNIIINIDDQGDGIPENKLSEVFEPFVRLDEARNTEGASVGLGLSIARTIIHKQGGDISLHNLPCGLRVRIELAKV